MRDRIRARVTYSNVTATLALFVALGGVSYAAAKLAPNSVRSENIVDGQVKRPDIAANAVNSAKVANGSLLAKDLRPGQGSVSAAASNDPKPDVTIKALKTVISTSLTTHLPSRIVATASVNVRGDAGGDVFCRLEIGHSGTFTRISNGPYADFAGAEVDQDAALPVVGTASEPPGLYVVRVRCGTSGVDAKYTAGNLAALAIP